MCARARNSSIAALLALCASGAIAQERIQERERAREPSTQAVATPAARERLNEVLRAEGKLGDAEVAALAGEVGALAGLEGGVEEARRVVDVAVREGCTGPCLASAVREMSRATSRGLTAHEAGRMVHTAIVEQHREGHRARADASVEERGALVREHVEGQLESWDRERARRAAAAGREYDPELEQKRERSLERAVQRGERGER